MHRCCFHHDQLEIGWTWLCAGLYIGIQVLVDRFAYAAKLFGLTVSLKKAEVMHPSSISYTPEKRTPLS